MIHKHRYYTLRYTFIYTYLYVQLVFQRDNQSLSTYHVTPSPPSSDAAGSGLVPGIWKGMGEGEGVYITKARYLYSGSVTVNNNGDYICLCYILQVRYL